MSGDSTADCLVCRKHREQGHWCPVARSGKDDLVLLTTYLGHLLVEPRRHAPGLADLTDAEAERVGWWCSRASRALRDVAGAEHVYAAVIGDGTPHLHVHLLPRYPGTPREYWWDRVDDWPDARRGRVPEITALVRDLSAYLRPA